MKKQGESHDKLYVVKENPPRDMRASQGHIVLAPGSLAAKTRRGHFQDEALHDLSQERENLTLDLFVQIRPYISAGFGQMPI
jgi:hypothetical protein